MSEATLETVDEVKPTSRAIRSPIDPLIVTIANRYGGAKAKELERFIKFAIVGVSGAIIDLGVLVTLQATLLPPTNDLNVALATTIAFIAAVLSNFTWTRLWVYPDSRTRSMRRQLAQFALISVIGWSARTVWITVTYSAIGYAIAPRLFPIIQNFDPTFTPSLTTEEKIGTIVAQLIAMVFVMLWNFFANRYWTYNDVD